MKRLLLFALFAAASAVSWQSSADAIQTVQAAPTSDSESESWTYIKPDVDLSKYDSVLIRPTKVTDAAGAKFDGISVKDRREFAEMINSALQAALPATFNVVQDAGPRTMAIEVTILGAKKTKGGVATVTRVLPIGMAANALKSLAGKKGTLTGSLLVEVEFSNSASGELLAAAIRRRTPDPLDVPATFSTTDTVKAIAHDMAETIREKLVDAKMPKRPDR